MSLCFAAVLFWLLNILGHLKGKCMTKLMKVCIVNNQRFLKMNKHQKTLDNNKKTLIVVYRCWHHHKTNGQSLRKLFEVMNEMFIFKSFRI